MQILSMRFRSAKPVKELEAMSDASLPLFEKLPGLLQKYYVQNRENGEVGGVYVWESTEHLQAYLAGPIVAAMPPRFAMPEPPRIEILDVNLHIRPETPPAADCAGWMIGSVRFKSGLDIDMLKSMSQGSAAQYAAMPGLVDAYRVSSPQTGRVGGIYVWATEQALDDNLSGPEVKGIGQKYDPVGPVEIEALRVSHVLRT